MDSLSVWIPVLPPGKNATYGYGKMRVYLSDEASSWAEKAALIIGAAAGEQGFIVQDSDEYAILIYTYGSDLDVDAPVALVIDTVSRKLGFDDRRIYRQGSWIFRNTKEKGIRILLWSR